MSIFCDVPKQEHCLLSTSRVLVDASWFSSGEKWHRKCRGPNRTSLTQTICYCYHQLPLHDLADPAPAGNKNGSNHERCEACHNAGNYSTAQQVDWMGLTRPWMHGRCLWERSALPCMALEPVLHVKNVPRLSQGGPQ